MLLYPTRFQTARTGNKFLDYYAPHDVFHPGVDFNWGLTRNADKGQPIFAPTWGIVEYVSPVGTNGGLGNYLVIKHPGLAVWTRYLHMDSITVNAGGRVAPGQTIGFLGDTGTVSAHLHMEVLNYKGLAFIRDARRPYGGYPVGVAKDEVAAMFVDPMKFIGENDHVPLELPQTEAGWAIILRATARMLKRLGFTRKDEIQRRLQRKIERLRN